MNYIVLDMEWNQPFSRKHMIKLPVWLLGEIVQIGAVKLDENYQLIDTFKIMVRPRYYTKMHKKVAKLTKITTEELQYGFPFPVAFKHFKKWCGEQFVFLTWGDDDVGILRDNMNLHKIDTGWIPKSYNVQVVFDEQISKERRQISLLSAIERIGETAYDAHDALNDARNAAKICLHLDMVKGITEYDIIQKKIRTYETDFTERSNHLGSYDTKECAFEDTALTSFYCEYKCENVTCKDFVKQSYDKYICIAECENGDEVFVRFKFTKYADGKYSVSRIIYDLNEENRNYYFMKKEKSNAA